VHCVVLCSVVVGRLDLAWQCVGELIDAVCVRVLREVKGAGTCRRATAGGGLLIAGFWLAFWKVGWLGQRLLLD